MTKTADEMLEKYGADSAHSKQVTEYSIKLFDALNGVAANFTQREKEYLVAASKLHDIGYYVSKKDHHKHTLQILLNEGIDGFEEEETRIVANIARYHRGSVPDKECHEAFSALPEEKRKMVRELASILKIADGLDKPHKNLILRIRAEKTEESIDFYIKTVGFKPNLEMAEKKKDLFQIAFKKPACFKFE